MIHVELERILEMIVENHNHQNMKPMNRKKQKNLFEIVCSKFKMIEH